MAMTEMIVEKIMVKVLSVLVMGKAATKDEVR